MKIPFELTYEVENEYSTIFPVKGYYVPPAERQHTKKNHPISNRKYYPCDNGTTTRYGYIRCHNCTGCARQKAAIWAGKCIIESRTAPRTWVCTFTLRNSDVTYANFQRFIKRVRKGYHGRMRYAVFSEGGPGTNTRPHLHALFHCERSLTWRKLALKYEDGFTKVNLIREPRHAAHYAAKYVTKDPTQKVRCSRANKADDTMGTYGQGWLATPF